MLTYAYQLGTFGYTLRSAGPAHPLFDNRATDEVASPEERSDEGPLLIRPQIRVPSESARADESIEDSGLAGKDLSDDPPRPAV